MLTALVYTVGLIVLGVVAVLVVRTIRFQSRQVEVTSVDDLTVDETAPERLSRALQFRTITKRDPSALDREAFEALHAYLAEAFPRLHRVLRRETVNDFSLLYTWPGRDPARSPIVLMAHTDVVPVEDDTEETWTHPPFEGKIADGFVWGRGALDDKSSAVAILEAVETLLQNGFRPERTVHLALGHDEEVGGSNGAQALAARVTADGTQPAFVLDEGGAVTVGALPDVEQPVALVGIAEKGYLSVEIRAEGEGGHSSVPPETTSIGVITRAVNRLRERPLPAHLNGVTGQTFDFVAPEMSWPARLVFANLWLTRPVVSAFLRRDATTDAAIRTTTAPTMLDAGVKDNVVPSTARAVVNFRILPSQSVEDVLEHVHAQLSDLPVRLRIIQQSEPTPVSRTNGTWFQMLQRTIREAVTDPVIVAPYLVPGTTDSRYYTPHSDRVYRFAPFRLTHDDRGRIHGTDERISVADYRTMVAFYAQLIRNASAVDGEEPPEYSVR